ncbi:MAG: Dna2/Cas4 domain-containing protein [Acidobacteria bacterium]|nr:Dna2/Cas4 domain-containing protein [Acidobacteriota bacterium]
MDQTIALNSLIILIVIFVALSIICLILSRISQWMSGLPRGQVIYADSPSDAGNVLVSRRYGLSGKPDYLLEDESNGLIPVEVKSGIAPRTGQPHRSHLIQLAVYFLLVEDVLQREVRYGLIRYRDRTLEIDNTPQLRDDLIDLVDRMRGQLSLNEVRRSHNQRSRCAGCSLAESCDERMI